MSATCGGAARRAANGLHDLLHLEGIPATHPAGAGSSGEGPPRASGGGRPRRGGPRRGSRVARPCPRRPAPRPSRWSRSAPGPRPDRAPGGRAGSRGRRGRCRGGRGRRRPRPGRPAPGRAPRGRRRSCSRSRSSCRAGGPPRARAGGRSRSSVTMVWPAFGPPEYRATTSTQGATRSTTFLALVAPLGPDDHDVRQGCSGRRLEDPAGHGHQLRERAGGLLAARRVDHPDLPLREPRVVDHHGPRGADVARRPATPRAAGS